jgi:transcriptional regulator with GAF, ATPase, and Fis domain
VSGVVVESGTAGEDGLGRRLEELLGEARRAGKLAELLPALERALVEATPAPPAPPAPEVAEYPGRFGMIGASPGMVRVFDLVERVAPSDVPVLVLGETGTGKELVAQALHRASPRRAKPMLAENCAALPATLLESELFGHKKGSFTGAIADRPGHFVAADGGTLFLDEVGDMPLEMQAKLLRVLEQGEVRPVGSNKTVHVDVRVVAATNKDLAAMAARKEFRTDLYYRLKVLEIELPPLRERPGDVALLVRFLTARFAHESRRAIELDPEAEAALGRFAWPGNVRQLENELRRAVALSRGRIGLRDLSPDVQAS